MTIYIALLKGINVGGHKGIKMADLKKMFELIGLTKVKTYIQSGNVAFESEEEMSFLKERIEREIKNVFDFDVPVMLRTIDELVTIINNCPYESDALLEGESIHVSFLANVLSEKDSDQLLALKSESEDCYINEEVVYLYFKNSIRDSKLAKQFQKLHTPATVRNWRTVNKLKEIAERM
ncbi:cytoplasmic protein [Bacillus cereus]|nr:cytoplasmic protein [Bacillus cereus]PGU64816.1 cytoplasmic protein [Bacillus cereus]